MLEEASLPPQHDLFSSFLYLVVILIPLCVKAIMCRMNEETQKPTVLSLSREHNPTQYEERMRIQRSGGNVR